MDQSRADPALDNPDRIGEGHARSARRWGLVVLALGQCAFFIPLAAVIQLLATDRTIRDIAAEGAPWVEQSIAGVVSGILASSVVLALTLRGRFGRPLRSMLAELVPMIPRSLAAIALISICAGLSEEVLFRGVLQPILGIWLTSLLFVVAHGMFFLHRPAVAQYAGFLFLASLGLGVLMNEYGLYAAIVAHAVIDLINLRALTRLFHATSAV
jgi:membrane protease YdiL (CAAX protease family)